MRPVKILTLLAAFVVSLMAQQPIAIGPDTSAGAGAGVVKHLNWYTSTPSGGCTDGASGFCVGHNPLGDTYYWSAWMPNASGLPVTSGLPVVGTINDYNFGSICYGSVGVLQLDTFSWSAPTAAHVTKINCMSSFFNFGDSNSYNAPVGWHGHLTSSDSAANGTWKSRAPFSKSGVLYLPVERQIGPGGDSVHDATILMSPDSGQHWCNPYTWAHRSGSPGCDSSNWDANGDAPKCDASSDTTPCSNSAYTDATHSSIMWKALPYGTENWSWINYGYQDGQTPPTGIEAVFDPANNTCFMLRPGDGSLACVPNASIMDISAWKYYTCPTITQNYRCPVSDPANWTSTFANRTPVVYLTSSSSTFNGIKTAVNAYSVFYLKEFGSYILTGQAVDFAWAEKPQGPWHKIWESYGGPVQGNFFSPAPALGYNVLSTNPPHVQLPMVSNSYLGGEGSQDISLWDIVLGRQMSGEAYQSVNLATYGVSGAGYQFSDGHMPGSFPRNGLIWSFDFLDQGVSSGTTNWPYFLDRANNSAVVVACNSTNGNESVSYTSPTGCGGNGMNPGRGTSMNDFGIATTNPGYGAHFRVFPGESSGYATSQSAPSAMLGNGSYSVVGVYRYEGVTNSHTGGIWSAGDGMPVSLNQMNGNLVLDWGGYYSPRYHYVTNFTFPNYSDWYFIAVTVQAQTGGCGSNCAPKASVWVGGAATPGVLSNVNAGVAYTAAGGGTPTMTPNVGAGPFVIGMNSTGGGDQSSIMSYATTMVYSRALTYPEVQMMYQSMSTKMAARRVTLDHRLVASVASTSNTQAILSYTARDTNPCTVRVSENSSMTPLVHDVDTALFSGANSDSRTGAFSATTSRIFVVGKRTTELGSDSAYYSRALQANTTHYYTVTCGTASTAGSFVTKNIPIGNTANELPVIDSAGLGAVPTFPNDRTTEVIDPQTGILAKRVWLSGDGAALSLYSGGRNPMCGNTTVGPDNGYFCGFPNVDGNCGELYYVIPTSGEVRLLGNVCLPGGTNYPNGGGAVAVASPGIDPDNPLAIYANVDSTITPHKYVLKAVYNGNFASVAPGTNASFTVTNMTPEPNYLGALAHAYDTSFDPSKFGCNLGSGGPYGLISCQRGIQDSYGWQFVMDMANGTIIAGNNVMANSQTRWCGIHSPYMVPNLAVSYTISHGLTSGGGLGLGPYETTLTANIGSTDTTFTVASEPLNTSDAVIEPYVMDAAVGDKFVIHDAGSNIEYVTITGKSGTTWTVTRQSIGPSVHPAQAWSSATASLRADCSNSPDGGWHDMWWKFLVDPTASGSGFIKEMTFPYFSGHSDIQSLGEVSERAGRIGSPMSLLDTSTTFSLSLDPQFAGAKGWADGNSSSTYPTYQAGNVPWFLDEPIFFGGDQMGGSALVSGKTQVYKYTLGTWSDFNRKQVPTIAATKGHLLVDISGPGSAITDGSGGNYTYCVANATNECLTGSSVGDVYFNTPSLVYTSCHGFESINDPADICIANLAQGQGAYQFGFTSNTVGLSAGEISQGLSGAGYTRKLTSGFGGIRTQSKIFKPLADASWAFLNDSPGMLMVKMPPFPTPDGVDRSTFVRAPISITTPQGLGIATATVEFGYVEQGAPTQYYCTSRRETCVAVAATVTDETPFYYKTTESGSYSRASCATSCTIPLPVLPVRVAYYQVKFYDAAGTFVQDGPRGVAMEGTVR